ncbi:UNVERIFIED_CONTAM: hypothetical protein GTU68_014904, partial [Idotea baltica]|nr:hypothetical protein [Idotea baltica]
APPARPLWVEFPSDEATFATDDEYLLGPALLVRPIVEEGAVTASVYFPHGIWFDVKDLAVHSGPSSATVSAPKEKIPVYQRGGTIIPRKERPRRASALMRDDPFTLSIALDEDGKAEGTLYVDDEHTMDYRKFTYEAGILTSRILDPNGKFRTKSWLERVIILGLKNGPSKITMNSGSETKTLESSFEKSPTSAATKLVIRKPGLNIAETFTITLH